MARVRILLGVLLRHSDGGHEPGVLVAVDRDDDGVDPGDLRRRLENARDDDLELDRRRQLTAAVAALRALERAPQLT